ncbi:uncharacterized protein EI97DRAFT_458618 [Westerdykella ornata]|uniref:CsbD-like domain-containing protein n=1 Tax=Westerdykella ornata TaxID=318751 RepID=A0A6A6JHT5_WESOR|nr:uncharacterized protein EI97DRAFT_458618 [Westerdykella ornata]KAF2276121.1 hypothetical protein EI97DRAFT_458618 [Westerdykella ornata]
MSSNQNPHNQPSLVAGHAHYVKGAAEETIGNLTHSTAWKESGAHDKAAAVDALRAAGDKRDPHRQGFGGVEETAGKLVRCEGMRREGEESKRQ